MPNAVKTIGTAEQSSIKNIDALISASSKAYGSAHEKVQEAAVAIIVHADQYGDCSRAKTLCRSVPARERNSLIGFLILYSPIGVSMGKTAADDKCRFVRDDSNVMKFLPNGEPRKYVFNVEAAKANKWYDDPNRSNPAPKTLNTLGAFYDDLDKMLKRMIAQAQAEDDKNRWTPEARKDLKDQAEEIRTIVNRYRAKHLAANDANKGEASEPAGRERQTA